MTQHKKPLRNFQRRLNQITSVLVLGLGLVAMMTIISEPESLKNRNPGEREIASIEDQPNRATESAKVTSVLTLECSKKEEITSWTQQVRLKGRLCRNDENLSILSTKIENKRNGYIATVFHQDREFTTDFIQLSAGENHLIVKHTLSDGNVEEMSITVTRHQ